MMRYYKHMPKKEHNKVHRKYTKGAKKKPKKKKKKTRNNQDNKTKKQLSLTYNLTNKKKSIRDKVSSPICIFTHKKILIRKVFFRIWIDCSSFSNKLRFPPFQIVHKMHKEATVQTFLHFSRTKNPCYPNRVSLVVPDRTQGTLTKENNCQRTLAEGQGRRM